MVSCSHFLKDVEISGKHAIKIQRKERGGQRQSKRRKEKRSSKVEYCASPRAKQDVETITGRQKLMNSVSSFLSTSGDEISIG